MGAQFLKPIISSGAEVGDAVFIFRGTAAGPLTTPFMPPVPSDSTTGPRIFTPGRTAFYAA